MVAAPPAKRQDFSELITALKEFGTKHDAPGSPISTGYSHGPGGNFSFPGTDPQVFHTVVGARGLIGLLPSRPSVFTNPTYTVLTGVTDDSGTDPDGVCDDPQTSGLAKAGLITAPFGRYSRQTHELDLDRLGQFNDRADPMDLTLQGSPIDSLGMFNVGPGNATLPGDVLRNEIRRKFWELGVSLHRLLSQQVWSGNPVNNNAGGGYRELAGMEALVTTGYVDAETGGALPSIDSLLTNMNHAVVADNGSQYVEVFSYTYRYLRDLAFRTGVNPVNWVIAMRPTAFYELTGIWPCAYLSYRCSVSGSNAGVTVNDDVAVRMRDDMREGSYLLIDGVRVPVVLDDGIPEATNTTDGSVTSGCFASDVYFLPLSVLGGQSTLFVEHFDYNNASIRSALDGERNILATVQGPWLTVPKQKNFCIQWVTKTEPRIVLRTPWLAARIQNVQYCPPINLRQPFPDDPYFVDGGATSRSGPSYYTPWASA